MDNQQEIVIELEIVPEDPHQQDLADVEEESQSILDQVKEAGYAVTPIYTGRMGGPIYDILVPAYHIIRDNKELLAAVFSSLTATLTLLDKHKKKGKDEQASLSPAAFPIEITFPTKDGPLTIKSIDAETAVKTLEQLRVSQLEKPNKIDPKRKPSIKLVIPLQKWFRKP